MKLIKNPKKEGMAILPPELSKEQVNVFFKDIKEKLGGITLLCNKGLLWYPGPPGFTTIYGRDVGWLVCWKPYNDENDREIKAWQESLPRDEKTALDKAVDLR